MPDMPTWVQWILGLAVFVGALATIWTKLLQPLGKLIAYSHAMIPMLAELLAAQKSDPDYLSVLSEIAAQFKSDSGSTLRDVVNRLEHSALEAQEAAKELRIKAALIEEKVAIVKELATSDRAEASKDRVAADQKLAILGDLIVRMKHLETLLATAQGSQQPITTQQLIPPSVQPANPQGEPRVIAVVEAEPEF